MEPKNLEIPEKKLENENSIIEEFPERTKEEVEDGYIDDRGFYTSPNGSFWDDDQTYFNRLGFDRHGGSYDKYGIYQPGPGYDEKTGLYKDQEELIVSPKETDAQKNIKNTIEKLREQEKKDEKTIKKFEQPVEESEESDEEDKSNLTFDEDDFKEAYENVMEIENTKMVSQHA